MSIQPANTAVLKDDLQRFLAVVHHVFAACTIVTRLPLATVVRVDSVNASVIFLTGVDRRLRLALRGRELPVGDAVVQEVEVRAEHQCFIVNRNPKKTWIRRVEAGEVLGDIATLDLAGGVDENEW